MRNSISRIVDSAEGLAWSLIKNVFWIVSTGQHMYMNAVYLGLEMYVVWRRDYTTGRVIARSTIKTIESLI